MLVETEDNAIFCNVNNGMETFRKYFFVYFFGLVAVSDAPFELYLRKFVRR